MMISRIYFWWFVNVMSAASVFYPLPVTGFSIRFSQTRSAWYEIPHGCTPVLEINNRSVLQQIGNYTTTAATSIAWLPIQRVNLGGWYWTNGEYYGNQISTKEWEALGMDCAVLRSLDKIIDDAYCERQYGNYICQGLKQCDSMARICLNITHTHYNIYNQLGTWYAASEGCYSRNQTLATFSKAHLKATLDLIADKTNKWANIWIGLRKREFLVGFSSELSARKKLALYAWGPQQPASTENYDCVLINTTAGKSVWQTGLCNVSYHHVCKEKYKKNQEERADPDLGAVYSTATTNTQSRTKYSCGILNTLTVVLLIYSILTTVLCGTLCSFLVLLRRQIMKRKRSPEEPTKTPLLANEDGAKLDEKNEKVGQDQSKNSQHNGNMPETKKENDKCSTTNMPLKTSQEVDQNKSSEEASSPSLSQAPGNYKSNNQIDDTDRTQNHNSGDRDTKFLSQTTWYITPEYLKRNTTKLIVDAEVHRTIMITKIENTFVHLWNVSVYSTFDVLDTVSQVGKLVRGSTPALLFLSKERNGTSVIVKLHSVDGKKEYFVTDACTMKFKRDSDSKKVTITTDLNGIIKEGLEDTVRKNGDDIAFNIETNNMHKTKESGEKERNKGKDPEEAISAQENQNRELLQTDKKNIPYKDEVQKVQKQNPKKKHKPFDVFFLLSDEARDFVDLVSNYTAPWIPKSETPSEHCKTPEKEENLNSKDDGFEIISLDEK